MTFNVKKENFIANAETALARCNKYRATSTSCTCSDFNAEGECFHTSIMTKLEGLYRFEYLYPLTVDELTGKWITYAAVNRRAVHDHFIAQEQQSKAVDNAVDNAVDLHSWERNRTRHIPDLRAVRQAIKQAQAV